MQDFEGRSTVDCGSVLLGWGKAWERDAIERELESYL